LYLQKQCLENCKEMSGIGVSSPYLNVETEIENIPLKPPDRVSAMPNYDISLRNIIKIYK